MTIIGNKLPEEYTYNQIVHECKVVGTWYRAGHNTFVRTAYEDKALVAQVKLHSAVVCTFLGKVVARLAAGEYHTETTRDRIDRCIDHLGWEAGLARTSVGPRVVLRYARRPSGMHILQDGMTIDSEGTSK